MTQNDPAIAVRPSHPRHNRRPFGAPAIHAVSGTARPPSASSHSLVVVTKYAEAGLEALSDQDARREATTTAELTTATAAERRRRCDRATATAMSNGQRR